ncbi:MAG: hypothetical protein KGV56_04985 [Gammaproteobacteria bacterium]|nr:hypothetical protein [Gammaproteobacteria bacterium]
MPKKLILISCIASFLSVANAQQYYGNGYTIVQSQPTAHRDSDLDVMVYKSIKSKKVYDALLELLRGSGWMLADRQNADPDIIRLYRQNYPDAKRTLNPIKLSDALEYIAGDAWDLVVDPVNHLVSFQLSENYRCFTLKEAVCQSNNY